MTDSTGIYHSDLDGNGLERIVEQRWPGHLALYRPSASTETDSIASTPETIILSQNYPNPFNPKTEIAFSVKEAGQATVEVYNVAGRVVRTLFEGEVEAGKDYKLAWDGTNDFGEKCASGVYFYRIAAPGFATSGKMVMLK